MIKKNADMEREVRERMRGGTGTVEILHIFRAAELTQGPPGQPLMTTQRGEAFPGPISRADFARFIIGSLSDRSWNLKEVTVGTRPPSARAATGA